VQRRAREQTTRLREVALKDPELARDIGVSGEVLARGTSAALSTSLSIAAGVAGCGGVSLRYGYWDECGWYGGAYASYGYWWGWGCYAWSPWCHPFSYPCYYWYGCWPRYSSWYSRCYAPYYTWPVYYATAVTSYVVREEVVYVEQEPEEEVPEPVLVGEGVAVPPVEPERDMGDAENTARATGQYLTLGDQAFRDGRYADAVHFYARAVQFSADDAVLWLVLSDGLFATGDYHYGAFALRKALELDRTLAGNPIDKHEFYADPSDFDAQLAVLELYVLDHPRDIDAVLMLAANYLFGGRPAAAVDLLESDTGVDLLRTPAGEAILEAARAIQYGR